MAETRTIELNIVDNANQTQQQFENLRQQIAKTTQEVDELTQAYGENSQEVTEAKGRLNELNTSYKELNKSATDTGATFADVYGEMQPLTTRMGEAEDRLYELALAGKTATKEYKDLLATTQNYLRVQQQVDLQVEAGAVPAAQQMTTAVGGVAGAFGIAEGTAALFGTESQQLAETMLKLQAVMAIVSGVSAFNEALPTFMNFKNNVINGFNGMSAAGKAFAITGIGLLITGLGLLMANWDKVSETLGKATAAQRVSNQVTKQATASIANEISAADKLKIQLKDETLTRAQKIQKVKEFQAAYPGLLQNMNLESMSIDQINTQLTKNIELLKIQAEQKAIEAIRADKLQEKLNQQLEYQKESIDLTTGLNGALGGWAITLGDDAANGFIGFQTGAENAAAANGKFTDIVTYGTKQLDKDIEALDRQSKANDKRLADMMKSGAQSRENIKDFSKLAVTTNTYTGSVNTNTDALDKQRESLENTANLQKEIIDEQIKQIEDEQKRRQAEIVEAARVRKKDITETVADKKVKATLLKLVEDNMLIDIAKLNDEFAQKELDKEKEQAEKKAALNQQVLFNIKKQENDFLDELEQISEQNSLRLLTDQEKEERIINDKYFRLQELAKNDAEALKEIETAKQNDLDAIKEKYATKDIARTNELRQKTLDLTAKSFSALAELAGSFNTKNEKDARKQFQVQKAFNLAAAITNTAMAVTGALTAGGNPIKLATGMQFVEAGIAATVGAANIIKIANSKFGSSSGSDGGGGNDTPSAAAAPMTANFNTIGSSGINQLAQLQQTPTQAYVVSTEVTSAQALDRNRVQNATL